jgi:hypothetical protein
MNSAELVAAAALGASAITAVASLGVTWVRQWLDERAASRARRLQAYLDVLTLAEAVRIKATAFGIAMQPGSGLYRGEDTAEGVFKQVDWLYGDLELLRAATVRFWLEGSADAVALANQILDLCGELHELAMHQTDAGGPEAWSAEIRRLATLRAQLGNLARRDLKRAVIDLQALGALGASTDKPELPTGTETS